jgi:hypothetical protein
MTDVVRRISVRLSLQDGGIVERQLEQIGRTGDASLDRLTADAARSAPPRRSASTPPRISARSATAAWLRPMTPRSPTGSRRCAGTAGANAT